MLFVAIAILWGSDPVRKPQFSEHQTPLRVAVREDAIVIPKGTEIRLDCKTGKPIRAGIVSDEKVFRVLPIRNSGREVYLEGLKPGVARLALTDVDGREDKVIVIVEEKSK